MTQEEFEELLDDFEDEVQECVYALEWGTGNWSSHQHKAAEIKQKLIDFASELITK